MAFASCVTLLVTGILPRRSEKGIAPMYYDWQPYVPVGQRIAQALRFALQRAKQEKRERSPVKVTGRKLATKFWGQAWCENLDHYSDFANRLPRGRRYLGNGSVVDLQ